MTTDRNVNSRLKALPVDWNYTIPFGLFHPPGAAVTVKRFLSAARAVFPFDPASRAVTERYMPIALRLLRKSQFFIIAPERPLCGKRTIHNLIFENGTRFISGARCLKKYLASFLRKTDRICCWSQTAAVGSGTRSTGRSARQVHLPCPSSEAAGGPPVPKAASGESTG